MNKYVKGWLMGKGIELIVAGTALVLAKSTENFAQAIKTAEKQNEIVEQQRRALRRRISR